MVLVLVPGSSVTEDPRRQLCQIFKQQKPFSKALESNFWGVTGPIFSHPGKFVEYKEFWKLCETLRKRSQIFRNVFNKCWTSFQESFWTLVEHLLNMFLKRVETCLKLSWVFGKVSGSCHFAFDAFLESWLMGSSPLVQQSCVAQTNGERVNRTTKLSRLLPWPARWVRPVQVGRSPTSTFDGQP